MPKERSLLKSVKWYHLPAPVVKVEARHSWLVCVYSCANIVKLASFVLRDKTLSQRRQWERGSQITMIGSVHLLLLDPAAEVASNTPNTIHWSRSRANMVTKAQWFGSRDAQCDGVAFLCARQNNTIVESPFSLLTISYTIWTCARQNVKSLLRQSEDRDRHQKDAFAINPWFEFLLQESLFLRRTTQSRAVGAEDIAIQVE